VRHLRAADGGGVMPRNLLYVLCVIIAVLVIIYLLTGL
jgi:hypothetical protein